MNGLTGKVAGVNVVAGNSGASGSSRVTIRGNTSITGNNQPLYIINGMPMDNSQLGQPNSRTPDWGDNASSLNADDIEEMTVLKGATAAALYGSRAKNGAIIITTKSGRGSKGLGVELNTNNTWENPLFLWDIQNQYGQGYGGVRPVDGEDAAKHSQNHWGERYDGKPTYQYDGVQRPYSYVKDQVLRDFYRTGFTSANNVSFTGGGDNGSFRLGISDMRNQGIVPNNKMRRNNISFGFNQNVTKKMTISANVDYVNENVDNRLILDTGQGSATNTILYVNSNMPTSALTGMPPTRTFHLTV
jgi:TonB-dependent SusC/RagA subfamily outer membrane receptor